MRSLLKLSFMQDFIPTKFLVVTDYLNTLEISFSKEKIKIKIPPILLKISFKYLKFKNKLQTYYSYQMYILY